MANITIYTTKTCPYCQMAKNYFKEHDLEYTEKDVSLDTELQKEMIEKSGQMGVPVIDINDEIVVGFDKPKIDQLIKNA